MSFNNSNSEVNCGNDSSLEISGEITLASWINPNSGADNSKIFGKTLNGQDNGYGINWDKDYEGLIPGGGVQHMNGEMTGENGEMALKGSLRIHGIILFTRRKILLNMRM